MGEEEGFAACSTESNALERQEQIFLYVEKGIYKRSVGYNSGGQKTTNRNPQQEFEGFGGSLTGEPNTVR